jgi:hypothetical protein
LPPVVLAPVDREWLTKIVRTGVHSAQEVRRSRILLELDAARAAPASMREIGGRVGCSGELVRVVARAYVERGGDVQATICRKKRITPPVEPKVTGEVEARLIALACSKAPQGRSRWSLRLLEKQVALMEDMPDLDHSTIGKILKKRNFVLI